MAAIEQIAMQDAPLGAQLKALAENLDYEKLLDLQEDNDD